MHCYPASQIPRRHNRSPITRLTPVYKTAINDCPFCISVTFSRAKVEKVVNPPQKPEASKSIPPSCNHWLRDTRPNKMPMISEPITLIENVPMGNGVVM